MPQTHKILTWVIAVVWIINGLFCKVLDLVPRHKEIVGRILGYKYSEQLTLLIGFFEICMATWILSGIKMRLNAITQIIIVAIMNGMEYILVPDLLLWGKLNSLFAFLFILLIYCNGFLINNKQVRQKT